MTSPPPFYDRAAVGTLYLERAALVAGEATAFRKASRIPEAREDVERIAAFGIDAQVAFCIPGASLFVPGAVEDTARAVEWLYRHLDRLTTLVLSLDTHTVHQVFHPASWVDAEGRHPPPFTVIGTDDVRRGRWRPVLQAEGFPDVRSACLEYCEQLERSGRYVLTIWPYHALLGGASHALVPALMEAALFHSVSRRAETVFVVKGRSAVTESYSVLSPEVRRLGGRTVGEFDTGLFDLLLSHQRVYVFGQAKSHCVRATLLDLMEECRRRDPALLSRLYVLEDAMSPVPPPPLDPLPPALDFPRVAEEALATFAAAGMHVVRTTDPV
ncbi:MAG TPA: nicotinamidase [Vicinamibacteria bacterium]|nr:nicotinamidase [Vicinamibacteria bacterium]